MKKGKFRQYFAVSIVVLLLAFLLFTIYKFANGFFGGLLLYIALLPLYNFMIKKKFNRKLAATICVFVALFVIIVPLLILLGVVGNELLIFVQDANLVGNISETISTYASKITPAISDDFIGQQITSFGNYASSLFLDIIKNIGSFSVNLLIALFLLYFMLLQGSLLKKIKKVIPFNKKNSEELVKKLKDVSYATVFVSGILALLQGALLTITFLIFDINGAFLWGFITAILSFIPILGPSLVWIPAIIIQLLQGEYWVAGGVLIAGIILSNVDNLLRPYLGKSIARIHPLVTLIGIFVGILLFGIIGVFVGPLLLAFLVLVLKMFKEEYYK